ncbi:hypothetical protein BRE01_53450 [Brevibacillus reuszeri]|uniref:Uncharacterized protein n=1 Tax=Brevibacillus reuszeri TaxID=54915 RepID=A0A0K9YKE1_9BACL|nr:hypothetical protein [Brevibacillus reuszeri]KNB69223.1 hypothetical protein ADS79_25230 [Brevibacillus reuszeri]MED1860160.1 hypothetical protein [Brevibacillus reuszeri]GED71643.1 hypothetical protein BRE01_53450 [Brevibacillus reuszeri]
MEYMALWFVLGIIFMITLITSGVKLWQKAVVICYYLVLSYIFISRKEEIYRDYHELPVPDQYWDTNSEWVWFMLGFYFVPFLMILLINYYQWFKKAEGIKRKFWIALTVLPAGVVYLCMVIIFGMYGYRP